MSLLLESALGPGDSGYHLRRKICIPVTKVCQRVMPACDTVFTPFQNVEADNPRPLATLWNQTLQHQLSPQKMEQLMDTKQDSLRQVRGISFGISTSCIFSGASLSLVLVSLNGNIFNEGITWVTWVLELDVGVRWVSLWACRIQLPGSLPGLGRGGNRKWRLVGS